MPVLLGKIPTPNVLGRIGARSSCWGKSCSVALTHWPKKGHGQNAPKVSVRQNPGHADPAIFDTGYALIRHNRGWPNASVIHRPRVSKLWNRLTKR